VIPEGAPIVLLQLSRNGAYEQEGLPENASPYAGKPARLVGSTTVKKTKRVQATAAVSTPRPPAAKPVKAKPKVAATARKPAFTVAGAPAEPLDEILLSARAKQLAAWVEKHRRRSRAGVDHWLYQHTWIVTGAQFGWSHGAEALRTLIAVDRRVQKLWGVGTQSELVARRALAQVRTEDR
jgi:hypothetical protein